MNSSNQQPSLFPPNEKPNAAKVKLPAQIIERPNNFKPYHGRNKLSDELVDFSESTQCKANSNPVEHLNKRDSTAKLLNSGDFVCLVNLNQNDVEFDKEDEFSEVNVKKNETAKNIEVDNLPGTKSSVTRRLENPDDFGAYDFSDAHNNDQLNVPSRQANHKRAGSGIHYSPNLLLDTNLKGTLQHTGKPERPVFKDDSEVPVDNDIEYQESVINPDNDMSKIKMVAGDKDDDDFDLGEDGNGNYETDKNQRNAKYRDDLENIEEMGYDEEYNDEKNDVEIQVNFFENDQNLKFFEFFIEQKID